MSESLQIDKLIKNTLIVSNTEELSVSINNSTEPPNNFHKTEGEQLKCIDDVKKIDDDQNALPTLSKALNRPSFRNRLLKNAKGIYPIQLQMKEEGLCIVISKERIVPELLISKEDQLASKEISSKNRVQRIKEFILGHPLKFVIMEDERK